MPKIPYEKVFLSIEDQLIQLKKRGLIINDEPKAIRLLENVSYYRLSGYWYPLLEDKKEHSFKKDSEFNTAFKLYCFDRELRHILLAEIEKIEVSIRSKMNYVLSEKNGPFWFQDSTLFSNPIEYAITLSKIGGETRRSDEEFIKSFRKKYDNFIPPSWMTMEVTSFGSISRFYENLRPGKEKREIAHFYGLPDSVFETWIHSLVYLRNVCAHHARLWNRAMSIRPQIPQKPHKQWIDTKSIANNRSYFILSMILYLLQTVNPKNTFRLRIKRILAKYPMINVSAMGFPAKWNEEPLWKD